MKQTEQKFISRQYMINGDFEFFHYKDELPVEVEMHTHPFYEVFFYLSGKVTYDIEGKIYRLRPGDIVLVNNKELHRTCMEPGETYERYVLWIDPEFIRQISIGTDLAMCFEYSARKKYNLLRPGAETYMIIKNIFSRLEKSYFSGNYGSEVLRRSHLAELLVYLNRAFLEQKDEDIEIDIEYNRKINSMIRYINENLHEDLSLESLAAMFYMSKYHLLREFKRNTGYTIHQYIQKKRLIMASMLLKDNMKVTEVSIKCGFSDYSNFIRAFRNEFGYPPKRYVKEINRKNEQIQD